MSRLTYFFTGGPAFAESFRLFSALGFDTSIVYAQQRASGAREIEISHIDYDGMNGLVAQLRETGAYRSDSFPAIPPRKQRFILLTWLRRLVQYFKVLWQFSRPSQEWQPRPRQVAHPFCVWRFFTGEQTARIREAARASGVSFNSHLFFQLNETVKPHLAPSKHPATWIIPVSLYQNSQQAESQGMRTSIMEVGLTPDDTPQTVHEKVRKEVDSESYWGAIVAVLINHPLPRAINRAILAATVAKKRRVGTFSNLGKWKGKERDLTEAWAVVPPVHPGQPLGVGAIEYNGKLGFGFKIDPFLGFDETDANRLADTFTAKLLGQT